MRPEAFLIALLLALAQGALAQGLTEALFLAEMPLVLTASRIATSPLDAPAPVTVIDRETIRASGFTEIHDVLRLVPGFLVADWPGGSPVVVNHGLGDAYPNRLLVLVDGRSVVNPATGAVDWQDLPLRLEDVERIEVVRGPNQASYGAGAFQGVIHIITREPGVEPRVGLLFSRGRFAFADNSVRLAGSGERFDWRLSLSSRAATNFRDRGMTAYKYGEDIERQTLNGQLAFRPELDEEWRLALGLSRGEDWVGSSLDPATAPYRARKQEQLSLRLAWHKHYAPDSQLSVEYGRFQRSKRENTTLSGAGTSTPMQDDLDTSRDALELQQIHTWSDSVQTVWGLGVRQDRAESARLLHGLDTVKASPWQAFANLDWRVAPDWLLHAGGTLERHPQTDTLFSPRLALNWSVSPEQSLRLSVGQGYRAPTLLETNAREVLRYLGSVPTLYGKIIDIGTWAIQSLKPELTRFAELGYVARYPQQGLVVDARLFIERHVRYIDDRACKVGLNCPFPAPVGYLRPPALGPDNADYFYNSGSIRTVGGDLTLDWRHPSVGRIRLTHAMTRIEAGEGTDRDTERTSPRHTTSLLWSLPLPYGLGASLGYYRVGDMQWLNDGDKQPSYERVDLKLAKRLGGRGSEDELALTLQNATGEHREFRTEHTVQRQAFVTLRLAW